MRNLILTVTLLIGFFGYAQKPKVDAVRYKEVTTTERDAFVVPSGEYWNIYNVTTGQFEYWDGDSWEVVSGGGAWGSITGDINNQTDFWTVLDEYGAKNSINTWTERQYFGGGADLQSQKITGLLAGTLATDAVNKAQLDAVGGLDTTANYTVTGDWTFDGGSITLGGSSVSMDGAKIEDLGTPIQPTDASTKAYVDAGGLITENAVADGYTLVLADASKIVTYNSASDGTINVPTNASVAYDIGTILTIEALGVGNITVDFSAVTGTNASTVTGGKVLSILKTATDTWRVINPPIANVSEDKFEVIQIACSDLTTDITTGTTKAYFRMPYACTLNEVRVSLLDAGTATGITVDINEGGVSVLSTLLTTDATEETSETATTPAVISDSALADDAKITIDFDAVPTSGLGVIVTLKVTRT